MAAAAHCFPCRAGRGGPPGGCPSGSVICLSHPAKQLGATLLPCARLAPATQVCFPEAAPQAPVTLRRQDSESYALLMDGKMEAGAAGGGS